MKLFFYLYFFNPIKLGTHSDLTNIIIPEDKLDSQQVVGIFSAGYDKAYVAKKAKDVMSKNPKVITENTFVSDALKIINDYKITSLFIMKDLKNKKPSGIIHLHDCLRVKN